MTGESDEKKLNDLVEMASRTGILWVAKDVHAGLLKLPQPEGDGKLIYKGLEVVLCDWLEPGQVMTTRLADVQRLRAELGITTSC